MATAKVKKTTKATVAEHEYLLFVDEDVPKLLESEDYLEIARGGAKLGASYLQEQLTRGVSEEEASFVPELHIYKDGKFVGLGIVGARSQEDIDKYIAVSFERGATAVLLVSGFWASAMASQNGGRPSQQPDRVNGGVGTVYLAPDNIVAQVGQPVFATGAEVN